VSRLVRRVVRLLVVSAIVGALTRVGRSIVARRSVASEKSGVRTGSFDAWPPVPTAPGRHPTSG
jgi:hypothetical protein